MAGKKDGGRREESREAAIRWYAEWKASSNDTFTPLLWDKHRYLVLKGGGGSGKSIFAGRKVLERVTTEPGHRWLVVRKVAKTLRQSCFPQLWSQANTFYAWAQPRRNLSDMVITFANGSQILFAGLDDPEKLKSIFDITGIWVEEASELEKGDFNQLDSPEDFGKQDFVVTFSGNAPGPYSCDKTYAEISAAVESAENVYGKYSDSSTGLSVNFNLYYAGQLNIGSNGAMFATVNPAAVGGSLGWVSMTILENGTIVGRVEYALGPNAIMITAATDYNTSRVRSISLQNRAPSTIPNGFLVGVYE